MNEKRYLQLNDIDAYKAAFKFSNDVWSVVARWDYFAKDTLGRQFCCAADSISANIAEGFGRYNKREKAHFNRIALGSVWECLDANEKAKKRGLIPAETYTAHLAVLRSLPKLINQLIKYTNLALEK
jgi:four helix bundle protein